MEINAFNKGDLEGAFIYFIFAKELIYIGETQKVTFARWYSHLYKGGTLQEKLKSIDADPKEYLSQLNFLSISCLEVQNDFPKVKWKTITQAVEHSIHVMLHKSQKEIIEAYYKKYLPSVNRYRIISDTSRTRPRRIPNVDWEYADVYAERVVKEVCKFL